MTANRFGRTFLCASRCRRQQSQFWHVITGSFHSVRYRSHTVLYRRDTDVMIWCKSKYIQECTHLLCTVQYSTTYSTRVKHVFFLMSLLSTSCHPYSLRSVIPSQTGVDCVEFFTGRVECAKFFIESALMFIRYLFIFTLEWWLILVDKNESLWCKIHYNLSFKVP